MKRSARSKAAFPANQTMLWAIMSEREAAKYHSVDGQLFTALRVSRLLMARSAAALG
jgi:hypothetical protein